MLHHFGRICKVKCWRLWTSLESENWWSASSATQLALHLWILPGEGDEANFGVLHRPSMVPMSIYVNFSSISAGDSLGMHHELLLENAALLDPISEIQRTICRESCFFLTEMFFLMFFYRTISPLKPIQ